MTARLELPVNPDGGKEPAGGDPGPAGQGVPTGGTTGQSLVKTSNSNYATGWNLMATALQLGEVANGLADLAEGTFTAGIYDPATRQATLEGLFTAIGQNPADHAAGIGQYVGYLDAIIPVAPTSEAEFTQAIASWSAIMIVVTILGTEAVATVTAAAVANATSIANLTATDAAFEASTSALLEATAPASGAIYTGPFMRVGSTNPGDEDQGRFTGPATPSFAGNGVEARAFIRPWAPGVGNTYSEWLTCIAPNPLADRWESAVWWDQQGLPYRFFEWIEDGGVAEVANMSTLGLVPGVWQEIREYLLFENTDGRAEGATLRRVADPAKADEVTTDGKLWRIVSRQTWDALPGPTSFLDSAILPWFIGRGEGRLDLRWVQLFDGVDGYDPGDGTVTQTGPAATPMLDVWAEDETAPGSGIIPDRVQAGDWTADDVDAVVMP